MSKAHLSEALQKHQICK